MIDITINHDSCIKCGHCVRACPADIFTQSEPKAEIGLRRVNSCIKCGHCAAVCPTGSITHNLFPPEKIHKADRKLLPTPEQVLALTRYRRSHRGFSDKPIPKDTLDLILEAAHRAPTASNSENIEFVLITNPEKVKALSNMTVDIFNEIAGKATHPLVKPFLKLFKPALLKQATRLKLIAAKHYRGTDMIVRGATALMFVTTPKNSRFGVADSNLAFQNASLMAESLGVAHFYIGFMTTAIEMDKGKKLKEILGVERDIKAIMAMGMPDFRYPNYIDRKDIVLERFE